MREQLITEIVLQILTDLGGTGSSGIKDIKNLSNKKLTIVDENNKSEYPIYSSELQLNNNKIKCLLVHILPDEKVLELLGGHSDEQELITILQFNNNQIYGLRLESVKHYLNGNFLLNQSNNWVKVSLELMSKILLGSHQISENGLTWIRSEPSEELIKTLQSLVV